MEAIGADVSGAHGADHDVVFLNLGTEAIEESQGGVLGGSICENKTVSRLQKQETHMMRKRPCLPGA